MHTISHAMLTLDRVKQIIDNHDLRVTVPHLADEQLI